MACYSRPLPAGARGPTTPQDKRAPDVIRATTKDTYTFINGNLLPEQLQLMATSLLNDGELTRTVQKLPLEDQARFVHRADQVRRDHLWLFSASSSLLPQRLSLLSMPKAQNSSTLWEASAVPRDTSQVQLYSVWVLRNSETLLRPLQD